MGNKQGKTSHASGSLEGEENEGRLHALSQGFYKRVRCTRRLLPSRNQSSTSNSHSNSLIAFRDPTGWTIAHHACKMGNVALCEIAKMGVALSARDSELVTPAHVAAEYNSYECLRTLFNLGVNLEERDRFGQTPAHYAVWHGNIESVQMLHSLGVKLEIEDEDNRTCAHYAARNEDIKMLQLLKELGVSMGRRDSRGLLPKHYAPLAFETMSRLTTVCPSDHDAVCASDEVFRGKETADCTTSKSPRNTPISSAEANLHRRKTMMDTDNVLDAQYREKLRLPSERRRGKCHHSPNLFDMSAQSLIIPLYGDDDVVLQALSEFETKERDAQEYEMKQDVQKGSQTHVPCADEEEPVSSTHSSKEHHSPKSGEEGESWSNAPTRIRTAPPPHMTIYTSTGYHAGMIPGPQNNAASPRDTTPLNWRSCTPAKPGPPSTPFVAGASLLDDNEDEENKKLVEAGPSPSVMVACGKDGGQKITYQYGPHGKARSPRRSHSQPQQSVRPQQHPETTTATATTTTSENLGEGKTNTNGTVVYHRNSNQVNESTTVDTFQFGDEIETPKWNRISHETTETMEPGEDEEEEIIADFCERTTSTMPMGVSPSTMSPQQTIRTHGLSSEDWCRPSTSISPRDRIRRLKESNKNNEKEKKSEQEIPVTARSKHAQPRTTTKRSSTEQGNSNNILSNCRSSLGINSSMVTTRKGDITCITGQDSNTPSERKSEEKTEENEDGIGLVKARILKWREEERKSCLMSSRAI